jgi:eukaryotic-like serine/threonine-protein kinase
MERLALRCFMRVSPVYHRRDVSINEPGSGEIEALVAAGRHADAAALALRHGDPARAGELYELVWDFGRAARAFRDAGDLGRALSNAAEGRDEPLVAELTASLTTSEDGARTALEVLARQRRHGDAAEIAERLGDHDRAIELFQRAHRHLDAARLLEDAGRDRDAGRLLEKVLDLGGDERPEAHLRLGRILARRGGHQDAARHLQEAARHDAIRPAALHHLVGALAAMGLRDAARDALIELRRGDPEASSDLDTFLRAARDAEPRRDAVDREIVGGRYRLERLLGAGAAGRVFRAIDEVTGRTVAIKMLHGASSRGSASYERFLREARVAGSLRHPAIVEAYDFSAELGFLVMEYLAGGSLATRIAGGEPLPGAQVRRMVLELLGGLELAHHRGVVHRDVKPANVFFDTRGAAKLGDFGVAHLIDLGQTQTGGLIGTLAYMSPEQITGAPITIAADLYSLGVTIFEALTGRLPFLGPDFVAQHLGAEPPVPSKVAPVAAAWDPVLARLLRKSPTERYGAIAELRADLETIELGDGGTAVMLPRPRRDSRPHSIAELAGDDAAPPTDQPRYQFETPLGATAISTLVRAVDTVLGRSVVIERFVDDPAADPAIARIRVLARVGSPFVQRALSYDRDRRTAVLEAPAGAPIGDVVHGDLGGAAAVRLMGRLARAAAWLHEIGGSHGAIGPTTVVVDDTGIPTILAGGLGPVPPAAGPATDVAAIVALVAAACGADGRDLAAVLDRVAPHLGPAQRTALASEHPADGEALYALADRLEVAMIRSRPHPDRRS